jgi:putative flavoprotein involved in K+ transport
MSNGLSNGDESVNTLVIGGGQAGLAAGYFLSQQKEQFIILDENSRPGASWRRRWDSLHLFSPSQFDGLPGLPYPKPAGYFPSKDEMADYLELYADRFHLPVRYSVKVDRLGRNGNGYHLSAAASGFRARNVIVATGPYQHPHRPAFAQELDKAILQFHSNDYCRPGQIPCKTVLVVGAANSGAEIALELAAAGKEVWLAGRDVGRLAIASGPLSAFGGRVAWWIMTRILNVYTPIGRKARESMLHHGIPLGRVRRQDLTHAGVKRVGRVASLKAGKPQLADGQVLSVGCVIWATGFQPDYSWIDLPLFGVDGFPVHERGVTNAPGVFFLGLPFQTAFNSALLGGVGADAAYIAGQISRRSHSE